VANWLLLIGALAFVVLLFFLGVVVVDRWRRRRR
jgi:hypothetical protein